MVEVCPQDDPLARELRLGRLQFPDDVDPKHPRRLAPRHLLAERLTEQGFEFELAKLGLDVVACLDRPVIATPGKFGRCQRRDVPTESVQLGLGGSNQTVGGAQKQEQEDALPHENHPKGSDQVFGEFRGLVEPSRPR